MKPQFKIKENKEGKFEVYYVEQKGKIFKKEVHFTFLLHSEGNLVIDWFCPLLITKC